MYTTPLTACPAPPPQHPRTHGKSTNTHLLRRDDAYPVVERDPRPLWRIRRVRRRAERHVLAGEQRGVRARRERDGRLLHAAGEDHPVWQRRCNADVRG